MCVLGGAAKDLYACSYMWGIPLGFPWVPRVGAHGGSRGELLPWHPPGLPWAARLTNLGAFLMSWGPSWCPGGRGGLPIVLGAFLVSWNSWESFWCPGVLGAFLVSWCAGGVLATFCHGAFRL